MKVRGAVALVTGANGGMGRAYVQALMKAGAAKVYSGVRNAGADIQAGSIRVALDITDPKAVAAAAAPCGDVSILINNAGALYLQPFLSAPSMEAARSEMETNYFGTLAMCRAFAPILGRNGGGALINMLSVVSWFTFPLSGSQCASKAAQFSLTNGLRVELRSQKTQVVGVFAGFIDTAMARGFPNVPKTAPATIVQCVIEGVERGEEEIPADERAVTVREMLRREPMVIYQDMQRLWDAHSAPRPS